MLSAHARLQREPIDSEPLLAQIKEGEDGAVCLFDGIVRNHSRNRRTLYLEYDSYPAMAVAGMEKLAVDALAGFPDSRCPHRSPRRTAGNRRNQRDHRRRQRPSRRRLRRLPLDHRLPSNEPCRYGKRNILKTEPPGLTVNHSRPISLKRLR